jgi:hypothetical protein
MTIGYVVISGTMPGQARVPRTKEVPTMLRSADMAVLEYRRAPVLEATTPSVREALRGLFGRLAGGAAAGSEQDGDAAPEPPAIASSFENRVRTLRENARAAYRSVEGSEDAAIDAALGVMEEEWRAIRLERDSFAEALKAIRLYAADARVRTVAGRALGRKPPEVAWDAGLHIAGRDRFPFVGEFDA